MNVTGPELVANFPFLERLAEACARETAFRANFETEEACRRWLFRARWPDGFRCPACGGEGRSVPSRDVMECRRCHKQTSVTAGTILHGTRKPLRTWFEAVYLIVQRGVNAKVLQRELGLTYKVAWTWGHKLRFALEGHVVPRDAGPKERLVLDASRTRTGTTQRPTPERKEPCGCSRLLRRDWGFPNELEEEKEAKRLADQLYWTGSRPSEVPLPADYPPLGSPWAPWSLLATFKGCVSEKHLRSYLDEDAFRENRRKRTVVSSFLTVARALVDTPARTYRAITARPAPVGHPLSIFELIVPWSRRRRGHQIARP
jgi:transposase-like protein